MFTTIMALLGAFGAPAQAASSPQDGACAPGTRFPVHVQASGLKSGGGLVLIELFAASDETFLSGDTRDQQHPSAIARRWVTPSLDGSAEGCIAAPVAGDYSLLVTHDRDATVKFAVSKDGLGLPRNDKLGRRRPRIEETRIRVGPAGAEVKLTMQYLHGLAGFGPDR